MRTTPATATLTVFGLFTTGLLSGAGLGLAAAERARAPYEGLDTLVRVAELVERSWVDDIDRDALVDAALRGMIDGLDAHSAWLSAASYQVLKSE
ncbi:MAG: hypothetical protein KC656_29470, partial [Myxococcales bacterium]|nr:hypothetical protein [Myxococcales bacterium]